jgi:integrase
VSAMTERKSKRHPGIRIRTTGSGARRYDVRYRTPEGKSKTRSFAKLVDAQRFQATTKADMARGQYVDPAAGLVPFREFSETWLSARSTAVTTHERMEVYLRLHIWPVIGHMLLARIKVSDIHRLTASLRHLAPTTQEQILKTASSVLAAAVDDELIPKNPSTADSVSTERIEKKRVVPWSHGQVSAFHQELPERYAILAQIGAGLGLRQGESFALSPDDIDPTGEWITIQRQVRQTQGKLHFALPKYAKDRDIPLPKSVREALAEYETQFPPKAVTLPWNAPDGRPVTARLYVTSREGKALNRNYINPSVWTPALMAAGIKTTRENMSHTLRHYYASVLLDAGENIRALSEYLGHSDPGFTLRVYTHLMPKSSERTRAAIDAAWRETRTRVGARSRGTDCRPRTKLRLTLSSSPARRRRSGRTAPRRSAARTPSAERSSRGTRLSPESDVVQPE